MKYNVEILPAAWEDLKKIEDWYLINFDVETAIKVSDHILDGIERLGDFPDSVSRAPDDWLNEQDSLKQLLLCRNRLRRRPSLQEGSKYE